MSHPFVLTGGGTGGHVFPALAVGRVLQQRGHRLLFIGTREGMEARLVPESGFEMAFIRSGGLNRVGVRRQLRTTMQLPASVSSAWKLLRKFRPKAVFSMGGYVAGPVMLGALFEKIPLIVMEPNAVPGFANRRVAGRVYRALLGFPAAAAWFPPQLTEVTGLPVREEFFQLQPKQGGSFTILLTGGSRGSRTLNRASRESWPLFGKLGAEMRIIHQTGAAEHEALSTDFAATGIAGEIVPFISNMAAAFANADLVVARAGAGAVSEIAAARMPSLLVPLPFAADDHQRKNAEALVIERAARMVSDSEMNGERLFREVEALRNSPAELSAMRNNVQRFARPGAAERAAGVMEEAAAGKK